MNSNWPKPSELLQHEVEQLHAIQSGKVTILSDIESFITNAAKRIEILQVLIHTHGDEWVGNSIELIMKFTPDLMNDQSILPSPNEPSPVNG